MQRAHLLESSKEIIFIDSTCSCESTSTSITIFLTSTKIEALPLAVLIQPAQAIDSYVNAFRLLNDNFSLCFGRNAVFYFRTTSTLYEIAKLKFPYF